MSVAEMLQRGLKESDVSAPLDIKLGVPVPTNDP